MATTNTAKVQRKADQYNDPTHNYRQYWEGREYENAAEEVAIRKLLKGKHFGHAVDVGGGFGRLCLLLENYAEEVTLAEPSQQQLDLAEDFLSGHPEIHRELLQAADLKFKDGSIDLLTMIRVMHHLPDPMPEFTEIARVLAPEGWAIIEVANYVHARNRIKHLLKGKKLPTKPVDIRSAQNKRDEEIAFVNHNPDTVIRQLELAGLHVQKVLSVSNLRSPGLKKVVPVKGMIALEKMLQQPLSGMYFGPSIFLLARKNA